MFKMLLYFKYTALNTGYEHYWHDCAAAVVAAFAVDDVVRI